jgi:hypothetical protein
MFPEDQIQFLNDIWMLELLHLSIRVASQP